VNSENSWGRAEASGEHAGAKPVGAKKRVIGLAREPDGRFLLDGHRQDTDFCGDAGNVGHGDHFSAPQFLNEGDLPEHIVVAVLIAVGRNDKAVDLPARRGGDGHAAVGELVDHRPLFDHAERVFERQHSTAGTDGDARGFWRARAAGNDRATIAAAQALERAIVRLDGGETILVC
jgi:hypothetical protein